MALNEMDARLISQGSETTAIGSSALVSVSDGEGQPQKNITLGNFADSMGAAVPQQQNAGQVGITGLYARTSEGKMVELTKESVASVIGNLLYGADNASSLASVVAGMMNTNSLFPYQGMGILKDANSIEKSGIYRCVNTANTPDAYGILTCEKCEGYITQTFKRISRNDEGFVYCRYSGDGGVGFSSWHRLDNFGCNTLEELATGVAGVMPYVPLGDVQTIDDMNDVKTGGLWIITASINRPETSTTFWAVDVRTNKNGDILQVAKAYASADTKLYSRIYRKNVDDGSWTDWV